MEKKLTANQWIDDYVKPLDSDPKKASLIIKAYLTLIQIIGQELIVPRLRATVESGKEFPGFYLPLLQIWYTINLLPIEELQKAKEKLAELYYSLNPNTLEEFLKEKGLTIENRFISNEFELSTIGIQQQNVGMLLEIITNEESIIIFEEMPLEEIVKLIKEHFSKKNAFSKENIVPKGLSSLYFKSKKKTKIVTVSPSKIRYTVSVDNY